MHLNLFQLSKSGHLPISWRHAASRPEQADGLEALLSQARIAESACFDSIFIADTLYTPPTIAFDEMRWIPDAMVLASIVASHTTSLGVVATVSTTFFQPFDVARKFGTLDRLTGGRMGWNIVTSVSDAEARNFGASVLLEPEERYARADEFVEAVMKLWYSWDSDALVIDKANGIYADAAKVRPVDHQGRWFQIAGPLDVPALPQGHPVLVQAGQSDSGRAFAAKHAEVIFTAQNVMADAQSFAADIRSRAERIGRSPDAVKILPGLIPILGATEHDALQIERELKDAIVPEVGYGSVKLLTGFDLSAYAIDERVPTPDELPESAIGRGHAGSRKNMLLDMAARDRMTIRELMWATLCRAHLVLTGTGEQIADTMASWVGNRACDGFNVSPALLPSGLERFVADVVPVLVDRGLFRNVYTGRTLRENLAGSPVLR